MSLLQVGYVEPGQHMTWGLHIHLVRIVWWRDEGLLTERADSGQTGRRGRSHIVPNNLLSIDCSEDEVKGDQENRNHDYEGGSGSRNQCGEPIMIVIIIGRIEGKER